MVIEKFEQKNPGKYFFTFNLTEEHSKLNPNLSDIDVLMRQNLLKDMLVADVVHLGD